jgi:hypothetical protein
LKDALNAFKEIENQGIQKLGQSMHELKDADIQAITAMEKLID